MYPMLPPTQSIYSCFPLRFLLTVQYIFCSQSRSCLPPNPNVKSNPPIPPQKIKPNSPTKDSRSTPWSPVIPNPKPRYAHPQTKCRTALAPGKGRRQLRAELLQKTEQNVSKVKIKRGWARSIGVYRNVLREINSKGDG